MENFYEDLAIRVTMNIVDRVTPANMASLTDINIVSPLNKQLLIYNSTSKLWENKNFDILSLSLSQIPDGLITEVKLDSTLVTKINQVLTAEDIYTNLSGVTIQDALDLKLETELDPVFNAWLLSTPPLYSFTETDPVFNTWLSTTPPLYSFTELDPIFTAWDKSTGISITKSQIIDLNLLTAEEILTNVSGETVQDALDSKLESFTETDPIFSTWLLTPPYAIPSDITSAISGHNLAYTHSDIALNTAVRHTQNTDTKLPLATPADHAYSGVSATYTAGESITMGDLVYFNADGFVYKARANATSTMICMGLALESKTAGQLVFILLNGYFQDASLYNWTRGGQASAAAGLIYVSEGTAGLATQTRPSTATNLVQIVGYALSADIIYFNPDYTYVEVV